MQKKILLIAFKFPPYGEIASKRWAKYAKYLVKRGFTVHVVTVFWRTKSIKKTWIEEVQSEKIIIHRIPSLSFHNLSIYSFKNNFVGKILKKIRTFLFRLLRIFYSIDDAQHWGYSLIPYCKKLIKREGINTIIATGQPFMVNYWAARLSVKTGIPLINDFRDSWNEGPLKKYFLSKSKSIARQRYAIENSRYITFTSEGMKRMLIDYFNIEDEDKIHVLYNGYDEDDFIAIGNSKRNSHFVISYAGGLSFGRENCLYTVLEQIKKLSVSGLMELENVEINLYGASKKNGNETYIDLLKQKTLKLHGKVAPTEALEHLSQSDLVLLLNSKIFPCALSSKLFEQMRLGVPMLVITPKGDISDICSTYNIQTFTEDQESEIENYILGIYMSWKHRKSIRRGYTWKEIGIYSYESQVDHLEKLVRNSLS